MCECDLSVRVILSHALARTIHRPPFPNGCQRVFTCTPRWARECDLAPAFRNAGDSCSLRGLAAAAQAATNLQRGSPWRTALGTATFTTRAPGGARPPSRLPRTRRSAGGARPAREPLLTRCARRKLGDAFVALNAAEAKRKGGTKRTRAPDAAAVPIRVRSAALLRAPLRQRTAESPSVLGSLFEQALLPQVWARPRPHASAHSLNEPCVDIQDGRVQLNFSATKNRCACTHLSTRPGPAWVRCGWAQHAWHG